MLIQFSKTSACLCVHLADLLVTVCPTYGTSGSLRTLWKQKCVCTVLDWNTLWLNLMEQPAAAKSINTENTRKEKMYHESVCVLWSVVESSKKAFTHTTQEWTSKLSTLFCFAHSFFCSVLSDGKHFTCKTNSLCRLLILHKGALLYQSSSAPANLCHLVEGKITAAATSSASSALTCCWCWFFLPTGSSLLELECNCWHWSSAVGWCWPGLLSGCLDQWHLWNIYAFNLRCVFCCLFPSLVRVSWLSGSLLRSAKITQCPLIADWVLRDRWDSERLFLGGPTVWLTQWEVQQELLSLGTRLQSVRQFKQSLLIVDDVKVINVGLHVRAALLADAVSWRKKMFYFQAKTAASRKTPLSVLCTKVHMVHSFRQLKPTFLVFGSLWSKDKFVYHN